MDLLNKNKEAPKEEAYIHEQLSLDFDLSAEEAANTDKENAPVLDEAVKKAVKKIQKPKKAKSKKSSGLQDGHLSLGVGSFGKFLQDMRFKNDYTISQVEQITKIKSEYIELLEMEKLRLELPSVYILAYARTLCSCYKVPEHQIVDIVNELRGKIDSSMPIALIENINIDHEVDEDSQKKIRHFAWLLLGALVFFAALVGIAVFMLTAPSKTKISTMTQSGVVEKFDKEKLKIIQAPIIIEATELPAKTN